MPDSRSAALFPAPVLDFADQRGDLLHSRLEHLAWRVLGHAAAGLGIAGRGRKAGVVVEGHQIRAPEVLGGQQIGEPPELMVSGTEGNSLGGQYLLEQFLAARVARAQIDDVAKASIIALARALESGALKLDAGPSPEADIEHLVKLPGVGPWTAHYIAMRTSRWPDAFPTGDIGVRHNLGRVSPKKAEEMSQTWRPWRSYAVMHIWSNPISRT